MFILVFLKILFLEDKNQVPFWQNLKVCPLPFFKLSWWSLPDGPLLTHSPDLMYLWPPSGWSPLDATNIALFSVFSCLFLPRNSVRVHYSEGQPLLHPLTLISMVPSPRCLLCASLVDSQSNCVLSTYLSLLHTYLWLFMSISLAS